MAAFAVALLLALLAALAQGLTYYRDRTPAEPILAEVGQTVALGGTRQTVRSITVAPTLPNADRAEPPVRGPDGSLLVLVVWAQEVVDPAVKLDEHNCDTTLIADDGTIWHPDGDFSYSVARPEALTCGNTDDFPLVLGRVREIGSSYVIPARYADQISWQLAFDSGKQVLRVRSEKTR
ncbi:MAG: hypothetical protein ABWY56_07320 [Propionibacteriaceae bacterium]